MIERLADFTVRRPWWMLGAAVGLAVVAVVFAIGAPSRLAIGSTAPDGGDPPGVADLTLVTHADFPVRSPVYRRALAVVSSQLHADPSVASLDEGSVSPNGSSTSIDVSLEGDSLDQQRAATEIEDDVDAGPLRVSFTGEVPTLLQARDEVSGDLWKLELGALAFALLVLLAAFSIRLLAAPLLCGIISVAGSLTVIRVLPGDHSLIAMAPAAVVGVALSVELPRLLVDRYRDEAPLAGQAKAVWQAVASGIRTGGISAVAVVLATLGVLVTSLHQGPSIVVACGLAAALAMIGALLTVPPLLVVQEWRPVWSREDSRFRRVIAAVTGWPSRSWIRVAVLAVIGIAVLLALAAPALDADSRPLTTADLRAGAEARQAEEVVANADDEAQRGSGGSVAPDLPLAAAVSGGALLVLFAVAFRSLRALVLVPWTLLPAAAAAGMCVAVFQDGNLAGALGQVEQGAVENAALVCLLAALAGVCAARSVALVGGAGFRGGAPRDRVGETAGGFVLTAMLAGTLVAGAGAAVLAGSGLYTVREFGLAVAAGLVLDLLLVRIPAVAALARCGEGPRS